MIISEATKYLPGSEEAKEHGCTCKASPENPELLSIAPDCPIHWHINLVSKTLDIHNHVTLSLKENKHLYYILIFLAAFMIFLTWGGKV